MINPVELTALAVSAYSYHQMRVEQTAATTAVDQIDEVMLMAIAEVNSIGGAARDITAGDFEVRR